MKSKAATYSKQYSSLFDFTHKIAAGALSVLLATTLMCPSVALAADYLWIDGGEQEVGNSGTGWHWVDTDNLDLNGYNGGGIYAEGDLNINVSGTNTITTTEDNACPKLTYSEGKKFQDGIAVVKGDLSISGEGNLSIESVDDGIYITQGDLSIKDVDIDITTHDSDFGSSAGIRAYGDVAIDNASVEVNGISQGIYATGYNSAEDQECKGGHVSIKNSDIKINLSGPVADSFSSGDGIGISAETVGSKTPASVTIDGSNIFIKAVYAAIFALNYHYSVPVSQISDFGRGIISIINSKIQSSNGAQISDFNVIKTYVVSSNNDKLADGNYLATVYKGQIIGYGSDAIESFDSDAICNEINIISDKSADTSGVSKTTGASIMPKTGDNAGILAVVAGVACFISVAFLGLVRCKESREG